MRPGIDVSILGVWSFGGRVYTPSFPTQFPGRLAQLAERLLDTQEATSSSLVPPTSVQMTP